MEMSQYVDEYGMIDKIKNRDSGDNRMGTVFALAKMMSKEDREKWEARFNRKFDNWFNEVVPKYHPHPGVILRGINPDLDSSDWCRHSRDQIQKQIIAFGYYDPKELRRLLKGHAKRGFLFAGNTRQNGSNKRNHGKKEGSRIRDYSWRFPDIMGPEIQCNFIRSFRCWLFYPVLLFFDIELFVGAILWRTKKTNLVSNHTLSQMQATHIMPTPWIWLVNKIMPPERLVEICVDHYDDKYVELPFIGEMFKDALKGLK